MPPPPLPRDEIARRLKAVADHGGNVAAAARSLNISRTTLNHNIDRERGAGVVVSTQGVQINPEALGIHHKGRIDIDVPDGTVIVGSDAHIWPETDPTPAMRAFMWALKKFRSDIKIVCLNGDVFDGASISRHPSIGWENRPTVSEELGAVQGRARKIEKEAPKGARRIWTLGNHDARFETAIANAIPEYQNVRGVHLRDHFPSWEPAWSLWINNNVIIKHRFKGGDHATWNNTLKAGVSIITGHLHKLEVRPFTDYRGTRYGVDTGTLATPYGPQFIHYTEGNPVNWRAGFVILTWRRGILLPPELVHVLDENSWTFRGEVYSDL